MSNAIAVTNADAAALSAQLAPFTAPADDPNFKNFARGANFHPRIQFFGDMAKKVKLKQFPRDHFGLVHKKDEITDLGEQFNAYILGYRYKAVDFRDKKKVKSYDDPNSAEFKECVAADAKPRPKEELSPCMIGLEYLLYIEGFGYATYHMTTPTLKGVAKKFGALMRQFVTVGHRTYTAGEYIYEGPEVTVYGGSFDLEAAELVNKEIAEFTTKRGKVEETVPEGEEAETAAGGRER